MTKHYSEAMKEDVVRMYVNLKKEGSITFENRTIETINGLISAVNISLDSLYTWIKNAGIKTEGKKPKQKPESKEVKAESYQWKYDELQLEALVPDLEFDLFGIRFWGFVGKNLRIPNYSRIPLAQLKMKIGLKLIGQSGLVKSVNSDLRKVFGK